MTVFPFPPEAKAPFSVVGFDWTDGRPEGELFVLPHGAKPPVPGAPFWSPEGGADGAGALRDAAGAEAAQPVWLDCFCPRGTVKDRLTQAAAQFGPRLWLHLAPVSLLFTLPCPDGHGQSVSRAEREAILSEHPSYFCPEFLCQCCHWAEGARLHVLLYDTEESLGKKLALAEAVGIGYVFGHLDADSCKS